MAAKPIPEPADATVSDLRSSFSGSLMARSADLDAADATSIERALWTMGGQRMLGAKPALQQMAINYCHRVRSSRRTPAAPGSKVEVRLRRWGYRAKPPDWTLPLFTPQEPGFTAPTLNLEARHIC